VLDPELPDLRIGIGERQRVRRLRMREERRIEVKAESSLFRPVDPRLEVLGLELVAVGELVPVDAIAGMDVHAVLTRNEGEREVEIGGQFLKRAEESTNEIMLLAVVDGKVVGSAGVFAVGAKYKVRHRASFGISVAEAYQGLGIGTILTRACIECARKGNFEQLELDAVADNILAISMYEKVGFREFGRNPKGFKSRYCGYQELVSMLLEL